jgi:hypothetical protein
VEITLWPRERRLRTPIVTIVVITSVFLFCTGAAAVNHVGTEVPLHLPYVVAAVVLAVVPFLLVLSLVVMNRRNVFLRWAGGRLAQGVWTGRLVEVDQPQSARFFPLRGGSLLVVAGQPTQPVIVLNPATRPGGATRTSTGCCRPWAWQ